MKLLNAEKYKSAHSKGKYGMPKEMDASKKDAKYFRKWAEYIYAEYTSGYTEVPYGGVNRRGRSFRQLRAYALGQQSEKKYADQLDACDPNSSEGFMNINWDIVQIMPKFVDLIKGKMIGIDFEPNTQAIDETSRKDRLERVSKMKIATHPIMKQIMAQTGLKPNGVNIPKFIETPEEVEQMEQLGGIRLEREIMIKDAIEITKYESDWSTIKDMQVFDIVCLNICATSTKIERATGKIKSYHILPENLINRASKYPDHRDIDYAGVVKTMTIAELRVQSGLPEKEIVKIAKSYAGFAGNGTFNESRVYEQMNQPTGGQQSDVSYAYDNFKIHVLEYYFLAKEAENYVIGYREKEGNMIYDKVGYNSKLKGKDKRKGKRMEQNVVECCYRGHWVIGTDYVYDYGKEYGIVKETANGVKRARLPITIYSDVAPSIVERCIAHIDDIQIATLKMRNSIAKLPPAPRMVIDLSVMEDTLEIAGKQYDMIKLGKIYTNTGVQFVRSKSEYGHPDEASNKKPIDIITQSGLESDMNLFLSYIQDKVNMIRQVTGINEVADGTTEQQDMLKGVMQGLSAATNNALRPHFRIYEGHHENWVKYTALKWQVSLLSGEIEAEYTPLGDTVIKHVKLTKDLYDYDFGIKLILMPSEEEKQFLLQDLVSKKENNQIAPQDFFIIYRMIKTGDVKKAQMYMAKAIEKQDQINHQRQIEMLKEQGMANAQASIMSEQERAKTEEVKAGAQIKVQDHEYDRKRELLLLEHELNLEKMEKEAELGLGSGMVLETTKAALNNSNDNQSDVKTA